MLFRASICVGSILLSLPAISAHDVKLLQGSLVLRRDSGAMEVAENPRVGGVPEGEPSPAASAIVGGGYDITSRECSFNYQNGPVLGNKPGDMGRIGGTFNSITQALPPSPANDTGETSSSSGSISFNTTITSNDTGYQRPTIPQTALGASLDGHVGTKSILGIVMAIGVLIIWV